MTQIPSQDPLHNLNNRETDGRSPQEMKETSWWQKLSLRTKATTAAIVIGTVPVLAIGSVAYYFANQSLTKQVSQAEQTSAIGMSDKVSRFIFERYGDIQVMSQQVILTDPKVREVTSLEEKEAVLTRYQEAYGVYDSIAVLDLNGNVIFKSKGKASGNHKDRNYFQEALKTGKAVITQPEVSKSTGKEVIHTAAPIKDAKTGQIIGVIRARMPVQYLEETIKNFGVNGEEYHLIDDEGKFFAALEPEQVGRQIEDDFPNLSQIRTIGKANTIVGTDKIDRAEQLLAYAPFTNLKGLPDLKWEYLIAIDTKIAFAAQRELLLTFALGTGVAALAVGAAAVFFADRATKPVLEAADAVAKIGQGDFNARIHVQGEDELAQLGSRINNMAGQLESLLLEQMLTVEQSNALKNIIVKITSATNSEEIFDTATSESRIALKADRVIYYRFNDDWQGKVAFESVADNWTKALGTDINDPCWADKYAEMYKQGRVKAIKDIYQAGLQDCHLRQLEPFQVKANIVAPVLLQGELVGLLIAHQCSAPRDWKPAEIDLFSQVANQVGSSLERERFLEQQKLAQEKERQEKEQIQRRALELLIEVDPVSKGDLTIRAKVQEDEIGTIADSYNATIESLRKIVTQVQTAVKQVAATTTEKEVAVAELSKEALLQTEEITAALESIQAMASASQMVASNASNAENAVQQALQIVKEGDEAMNRTVDGFVAIRENVAETAKKVKRLGESSQKISKVVNLISSFAEQTNLLALNASIEAAHAGEEGRGFAVVADEVRSLSKQSAEATAEIEALVSEIQAGTNEVVAAMEAGTEQVVAGTRLVDETRLSLNQITAASQTINQLVDAISQAAVQQSQDSEVVNHTMAQIAAISNKTSSEAMQVSESFKELLTVAQKLEESVAKFKV